MTHGSHYLGKLYNDLIANSPQTISIDIPSDMGKGRIAQTQIKHGIIFSDWQMCYQSDMNVQGTVSKDYMQIIFCLNDAISWGIMDEKRSITIQKNESCIYAGHGGTEYACYKKDSNFSFKSIKIPIAYFSQLLTDYFDGQEATAYEKKLLDGISKVPVTPIMEQILAETSQFTQYRGGLGYLYLDGKLLELLSIYLGEVLELDILMGKNVSMSRTERTAIMEAKRIIDSQLAFAPSCEELSHIDRHNHKEIWNTLDDLKKLQLLQDKNFAWTIGRVDDRLYETNFPDIMMESEILAELQSKPLPDNVHAAFLKTCYNFADKMGLKLNLREHKQTHSYCWSTSSSSNVFYVDMNLKTYRCTCTVGRSRYSLFDFSYENLTNYRPVAVTCNSYAECKDCKIGGFCGGGCQLSHQIDFKKCCTYEEEVFSHFMKTLFIPYIKSKYNEVNQNERKAENRCT